MGALTYTWDPIPGGANEDIGQVNANFTDLKTLLNGNLDKTNLSTDVIGSDEVDPTLAATLGVSKTASVRRGKSIIATSEARTNAAFGTLTTPDQVQNLVLPSDGLIAVLFSAQWKESVVNDAEAAIFLGSTQVTLFNQSINIAQTATLGSGAAGTADRWTPLSTGPVGLISREAAGDTPDPVTTGQIAGFSSSEIASNRASHNHIIVAGPTGGACFIYAAAGTYDVSIRFRGATGTVTAKNRKLWVWTLGF
jgi:hypothetical protein